MMPDIEDMVVEAMWKAILMDPRRSRSDAYQRLLESLERHNVTLGEHVMAVAQAWRDGG